MSRSEARDFNATLREQTNLGGPFVDPVTPARVPNPRRQARRRFLDSNLGRRRFRIFPTGRSFATLATPLDLEGASRGKCPSPAAARVPSSLAINAHGRARGRLPHGLGTKYFNVGYASWPVSATSSVATHPLARQARRRRLAQGQRNPTPRSTPSPSAASIPFSQASRASA